jgi:hypothetical protein
MVAGGAAQLAPAGVLVLEHASRRAPPDRVAGVRRVRTVRAGDSALSLYEPSRGEVSRVESPSDDEQ